MDEVMNFSQDTKFIPAQNAITENFQAALQMVDDIVLKNYISKLSEFEIVPMDEHTKKLNLSENVRLFKITEMVYEKDEFATYKFASVFNALSTANCAVFVMVDSDGSKTDFYMGIRSLDSERTTSSLRDTLKNAMMGQFPGIKTKEYLEEDMNKLLDKSKLNNLSIVSCVANNKDDENHNNSNFIQGLEKLVLAMQGERYTGIIIANGTTQDQLVEIRQGYEQIYTQLSPIAKTQINYAYNHAINSSRSVSEGSSHGTNRSETVGYSETKGTGESHSISKENTASKVAKGIAAAASIAGPSLALATDGVSLVVGGIAAGLSGFVGAVVQKTETDGKTSNFSQTDNASTTYGQTDTDTTTTTDSKGLTQGNSQSATLTLEDKTISNMLKRLDMQLERLQEFESLGMWECAAYFLSENSYAAEIAASTYKALMRGENSGVEVGAINSWHHYNKKEITVLKEYALNMIHPVFQYNGALGNIQVTPSSLVSGNELAIHMGLPRKSVCGFPVIEHADFGKEVVSYSHAETQTTINLGKIFNMGSECNSRVKLDRNSLAMHTFVTGSTGSGKSNTIYEILRQLDTVGVNFMVIEPAKGEYKNVFGRLTNVKVVGTNPEFTELLKINPFKFPKGVHVLEHIDRLIEIFNVCWPMYAAMPAVLKEAVLQAYEVCGWDLEESKNLIDDDLFPNFQDLLGELRDVLDHSSYDNELKNNYKGSLETRIRSLTNGLNGQIFSVAEMDNTILFDQNIIVDLSRIGSLETKALIMGILVMRLNEHRMTYAKGMNEPLKHVTVLEEAHNILKRTSSEQSSEGANLAGKSVEMLSNAIAEMRTYGEGFIIVDQSPSAVDHSAIRNTNTKIIMRLPDENDRRTSGKSAALKDEQLDEIAKLPKGVAVVYQNDWLEPVLCKISKYAGEESPYTYDNTILDSKNNSGKWFESELLKLLMKGCVDETISIELDRLKKEVSFAKMSTKNKIFVHRLLREYEKTKKLTIWEREKFGVLSSFVTEVLNCKNEVNYLVSEASDFEELSKTLHQLLYTKLGSISEEMCVALSQCFMKDYSGEDPDRISIYAVWRESVKNRGGLV